MHAAPTNLNTNPCVGANLGELNLPSEPSITFFFPPFFFPHTQLLNGEQFLNSPLAYRCSPGRKAPIKQQSGEGRIRSRPLR